MLLRADHSPPTEKPSLPPCKLTAQLGRNNCRCSGEITVAVHSEPNLGRTYGAKGQTPVVHTTGQRQKVNAISAINAQGAFWCSVYTGMLNAGTFVAFLQDFLKGRRGKVYLVVDGHPSHRAKRVQQFVQSTKGRLELHFLPPYAPDLNPDEFVWQHAKTNGVAKKPLKKNESLRKRVEADLESIRKNKPLVRSFFQADSVVYAADL